MRSLWNRGAHTHCSARNDVRGVRSGSECGVAASPGPFWGAVEAGEEAVEGQATAESSATGCGADHDRGDDQLAQSKLVGKPLAALDQSLGQW